MNDVVGFTNRRLADIPTQPLRSFEFFEWQQPGLMAGKAQMMGQQKAATIAVCIMLQWNPLNMATVKVVRTKVQEQDHTTLFLANLTIASQSHFSPFIPLQIAHSPFQCCWKPDGGLCCCQWVCAGFVSAPQTVQHCALMRGVSGKLSHTHSSQRNPLL